MAGGGEMVCGGFEEGGVLPHAAPVGEGGGGCREGGREGGRDGEGCIRINRERVL